VQFFTCRELQRDLQIAATSGGLRCFRALGRLLNDVLSPAWSESAGQLLCDSAFVRCPRLKAKNRLLQCIHTEDLDSSTFRLGPQKDVADLVRGLVE
jgi:hypothetical protein